MAEYSETDLNRFARNDELLPLVLDAARRGDEAEEDRLMRQMIYPAESLLWLKDFLGADQVRAMGLRTDEADRQFGKGWLDRHVDA
ncbi:MAG: hypothetical protein ACK4FJ_17020 [Ferrovibrio sp.]|uniref:hypothetical protein n=1 Tax=Ferrovibrio sp. TaxID=1917215 RepID=UPI001BC620AC|nr:hypothetical protein [Alphaproteobacteria bacterium]